MDYKRIKRLNKKQFDYKMAKEGQTLYNYSKDVDEKVFFASTTSNKPSQDKLTIFYKADGSIDKGDILYFKGSYYITLNENYPENDVWRCSIVMKCNTVWNLFGEVVPFVSCDLSSPNPSNGMISGTLNFYTKDIPLLHTSIGIDACFYDFGGCYKLVNKFFIDGLAYLYFKRETHNSNIQYALQDAHNSTYITKNTRAQFYLGSETSGYYLPTAEIEYTSSDENIAVVENGVIIPKENGNVTITAKTKYTFDYGEKTGLPKEYTGSRDFIVNKDGEDLSGYIFNITGLGNGWVYNNANRHIVYISVTDIDGNVIEMNEVPRATFIKTDKDTGAKADISAYITIDDAYNEQYMNSKYAFALSDDNATTYWGGDTLRTTLTYSNGLSAYIDQTIMMY